MESSTARTPSPSSLLPGSLAWSSLFVSIWPPMQTTFQSLKVVPSVKYRLAQGTASFLSEVAQTVSVWRWKTRNRSAPTEMHVFPQYNYVCVGCFCHVPMSLLLPLPCVLPWPRRSSPDHHPPPWVYQPRPFLRHRLHRQCVGAPVVR